MQDGSESENYIIEDFIDEPEDEDGENTEDIYDQINKQNSEVKEIPKTRSEGDKRQKFDSAEYEIQKQKAKIDAKKEANK